MSNFPALIITRLPFAISSTDMELIKRGSVVLDEVMFDKMPGLEDPDRYRNENTKRFPTGVTIKLSELIHMDGECRLTEYNFPLFTCHSPRNQEDPLNFRYILLYTDYVDGLVTRSGDTQRLHDAGMFAKTLETKYGRVYALDLSDCSCGYLVIDEVTLVFEMIDVMEDVDMEELLGPEVTPPVEIERFRAIRRREHEEEERRLAAEEESRNNANLHLRCNLVPKQDPTPAVDIPAFYVDEEPVPSVGAGVEAHPVPPPLPREIDEPVEVDGEALDRLFGGAPQDSNDDQPPTVTPHD